MATNGHDEVVDLVNAKMRIEMEIQKAPQRIARIHSDVAERKVTLQAINDKLARMEKDARR